MPEILQERNERIRELEDDAAERERDNKMQATLKDNLIKTLQDQNETLIKNAGSLRGAVTAMKEQLQVQNLAMFSVLVFIFAFVPRCLSTIHHDASRVGCECSAK